MFLITKTKELIMKIGVCVSFTEIEKIPEQFRVLREQGFDNCQMLSWNPATWTDDNAQKILDYQKEYGCKAKEVLILLRTPLYS